MNQTELEDLNGKIALTKGGEWWDYTPAEEIADAWPLLVEAHMGIQWEYSGKDAGWVLRALQADQDDQVCRFDSPDEIPAAICRAWLAWREAQG